MKDHKNQVLEPHERSQNKALRLPERPQKPTVWTCKLKTL